MLRSMTGFGRCVMEDADWTQTWEIRSVNNRHLDLKWRLPLQARGLESRLERVVRRFAARGPHGNHPHAPAARRGGQPPF